MRWACLLVALIAACGGSPDPTTTIAEEATTTAPASTTTIPTTTTSAIAVTTTTTDYTTANFGVDLIILESECFNTAGALVTVEPELRLYGPVPPDDLDMTVVYEISGGENIERQSIDIDGSNYSYNDHIVSTTSCDYELVAEVVEVVIRRPNP